MMTGTITDIKSGNGCMVTSIESLDFFSCDKECRISASAAFTPIDVKFIKRANVISEVTLLSPEIDYIWDYIYDHLRSDSFGSVIIKSHDKEVSYSNIYSLECITFSPDSSISIKSTSGSILAKLEYNKLYINSKFEDIDVLIDFYKENYHGR